MKLIDTKLETVRGAVAAPARLMLVWISISLAAIVVVSYWPIGQNEFIHCDDPAYITENPTVQHGLNAASLHYAFTTFDASNWHPLTWLSHALDCQLLGASSAAHHRMNLAIHVASTVLLFLAMRELTGNIWCSALVAAIFGLHPLHVESVAWASERKDTLSGFFFMLTLWIYALYAKRPAGWLYAGVFVSFALGLLAKPTIVTLPFVLLLLDYWPLKRMKIGDRSALRLFVEKVPLLCLVAGSSVMTFLAQKSAGSVSTIEVVSIAARVENALLGYAKYIGKAFWPTNLAFFYPFFPANLSVAQAAMSAVLLLCITVICLIQRRRPFMLVGWLWFLGMLVPTIGLVQVGMQSMADRYMYLPLIGLSIVVVWWLADLRARWARTLAAVGTVVLICALSVLTWRELRFWKNGVVLFERSLRITEDNAFARNSLGIELASKNQFHEAVEQLQRGVKLAPLYAPAQVALGKTLLVLGRTAEAERPLLIAQRLTPEDDQVLQALGALEVSRGRDQAAIPFFERSLKINPAQPLTEYNLAMAHKRIGEFASAERHFRIALQLNPNDAGAYAHLAFTLTQRGAEAEAESALRQSLRVDPNAAQNHYHLAMRLLRKGDVRGGVDSMHRCVQLDPNFVEAVIKLGWILSTAPDAPIRNPADGLLLAKRAEQLTAQRDAGALDTLAAAYAANGQYSQAVETAQRAAALAKTSGKTPLAAAIDQRLLLYRDNKAFIDPSLAVH